MTKIANNIQPCLAQFVTVPGSITHFIILKQCAFKSIQVNVDLIIQHFNILYNSLEYAFIF